MNTHQCKGMLGKKRHYLEFLQYRRAGAVAAAASAEEAAERAGSLADLHFLSWTAAAQIDHLAGCFPGQPSAVCPAQDKASRLPISMPE